MATMEKISEALKLIPEKKSLLRQAFEDLQSHSSSLSSFSLSWSDLDSHFSALQSTLEAKFKLLQSQPPEQIPKSQPVRNIETPQLDKDEGAQIDPSLFVKVEWRGNAASVPARPEVKAFCENMDGLGLRNYICDLNTKERSPVKAELRDAFKCAKDAAAMVLDALEGFYVPNSKGNDSNTIKLRKVCIEMFDELMESKVGISPEVRERAKSLALDWKEKVSLDDSSFLEPPHGFLCLVACYGLLDVFSTDDLFDMAVVVASRFSGAIPLIRMLCFGDKISDLIQKIISKGRKVVAVRYIFEFELAGKYQPVTLLQDYVNEAKTNAEKIRKDGKNSLQSLNSATMKENSALNSVLTIIEDYKIEAESLKQSIIKRLRELEKEKADRKKKRPQKLGGFKRPRVTPYLNSKQSCFRQLI